MFAARHACRTALFLALLPCSSSFAARAAAPPVRPADGAHNARAQQKARLTLSRLPLAFEPNVGQTARPVQFLSRGDGYTLFLTAREAVLAAQGARGHSAEALRLSLTGANASPRVSGERPLRGQVNYLVGNNPQNWHTHLPTYGQVRLQSVYPGIDLVYHGSARQLEYDFVVAPGARPDAVKLTLSGARSMRLRASGDLEARLPSGRVALWHRPSMYQTWNGKRQPVAGRFLLCGPRAFAFRVGPYDHKRPLVIDPILGYTTYLGGMGEDQGHAVAVNLFSANQVYVAGQTASPDFPVSGGASQPALHGTSDAFVTAIDTTQTGANSLLFSTYLGGSGDDAGYGIALNSGTGGIDVAGSTTSPDFPVQNAFQGAPGGGSDVFVTELTSDGSALLYSTYLGGPGADQTLAGGGCLASDNNGHIDITGQASAGFPVTASSAYKTTVSGSTDAFVAQINPQASGAASLLYATFLGGASDDYGVSVSYDPFAQNIYVTGRTYSSDFGTTPTTYQSTFTALNGGYSAFVAQLDLTKSGAASRVYSTYLGATGSDTGTGIVFGLSNNGTNLIYVAGTTGGTTFPTLNGFQTASGGSTDAFVSALDPTMNGSAGLVYSTYLGGTGSEAAASIIQPDFFGPVYVCGSTLSANFPVTGDAVQNTFNGSGPSPLPDGFVTAIDPSQTGAASFLYSTYLGGTGADTAEGLGVDSSGNVYVAGTTSSTDFPHPTVPDGLQTTQADNGAADDAFLTTITFASPLTSLTVSPTSICGGETFTATVTLQSPAPFNGANVSVSGSNGQFSGSVYIYPGQTTGSDIFYTNAVAVTTPITATASYNNTTATAPLTLMPTTLTTLTLSPTSVLGGDAARGSVTLSCPVALLNSGGETVTLTSSNPAVASVPASVSLASGATTATFPITTSAVQTSTPVTITASFTLSGQSAVSQTLTATLTVTPFTVATLTLAPTALCGGLTSTATVTLNGLAPVGGKVVTLTSSNPAVTSIPATVTVPAGQSSAKATITTQPVTTNTPVTISAAVGSTLVQSATLTVQPMEVSTVMLNPTTVQGGDASQGTVTLNCAAPTGGSVVTLSTNNSAIAAVPAAVTVAAGTTTATFPVSTSAVTGDAAVTVSAALGSTPAQSAALTVQPLAVLSLTLSPTSVAGGGSVIATITLNGPAPASGSPVTLSTTNTALAPVPATVIVPAGAASTAFVIFTQAAAVSTAVTLTAQSGGATRSATLTIQGSSLASLTVTPASVVSGSSFTGKVTLNGIAPAAGLVVGLASSDKTVASVPASITVPAGATTASFTLTAPVVTATRTATLTATLAGVAKTAAVTVTPVPGGTFAAGLNFFSVPYDYPGISLDQLFGYAHVSLAVWVPTLVQYVVTPSAPANEIRLGRAYWSRFPNALGVTQIGTPADTTANFPMSLDTGWNGIGDPFPSGVTLSSISVVTKDQTLSFATASSAAYHLINPLVYTYATGATQYTVVSATDTLQPGKGYWIETFAPVTLSFPHP